MREVCSLSQVWHTMGESASDMGRNESKTSLHSKQMYSYMGTTRILPFRSAEVNPSPEAGYVAGFGTGQSRALR